MKKQNEYAFRLNRTFRVVLDDGIDEDYLQDAMYEALFDQCREDDIEIIDVIKDVKEGV